MTPDPYEPCPCGSGKKYKFCCRQKRRERKAGVQPFVPVLSTSTDFGDEVAGPILVGDLDEGSRHCDQGLRLMSKGEYKNAIPWFRKSIEAAGFIPSAFNNLALCLFIEGDLEGAVHTQREGLEASPFPNPFGLCSLAVFHLADDKWAEAERYLEEALEQTIPNSDHCVKICETLARFHRHQDLLRVADASDYTEDPGVRFFTGIAAANLEFRDRAMSDLRRVGIGHPKAELALRYVRCLEDDAKPNTAKEDWPYFWSLEILPIKVMDRRIKKEEASWLSSRIAVEFCQAALNDMPDQAEEILDLLCHLTHSEVRPLLWALAKGSFGPDALRTRSLQRLEELGELKRGEAVNVLMNGKRSDVISMGTRLNPEIRYGGKLPPALDKRYARIVRESRKSWTNWEKNGEQFCCIIEEAPDFFPARFNYAVSLLHQEKVQEAEPILKKLIEEHPDYLFAQASYLQLLTLQNRLEEAEALVRAVTLPEETHPDAMAAWMVAQGMFCEQRGYLKEADHCFEMARRINPHHPAL